MLRYSLRFAVALATFLSGLAVSKVLPPYQLSATEYTQAQREVLAVEQAYIAAHLQRDTVALDRILADDFTFRSCGRSADKEQRLALVADPDFAFTNIETEPTSVIVDGDRAYINGRARVWVRRNALSEEEAVSPWYEYTRAFEQHEGRWQMVSVQVRHFSWR
jgi:ketosteroid isomerase-like protein